MKLVRASLDSGLIPPGNLAWYRTEHTLAPTLDGHQMEGKGEDQAKLRIK